MLCKGEGKLYLQWTQQHVLCGYGNGEDYTFNMQKFATKMEASEFFIFKFSRNAAEPIQITPCDEKWDSKGNAIAQNSSSEESDIENPRLK
jgi:hypothetical protein